MTLQNTDVIQLHSSLLSGQNQVLTEVPFALILEWTHCRRRYKINSFEET